MLFASLYADGEPDVLLLDEPTNHLDRIGVEEVMEVRDGTLLRR